MGALCSRDNDPAFKHLRRPTTNDRTVTKLRRELAETEQQLAFTRKQLEQAKKKLRKVRSGDDLSEDEFSFYDDDSDVWSSWATVSIHR